MWWPPAEHSEASTALSTSVVKILHNKKEKEKSRTWHQHTSKTSQPIAKICTNEILQKCVNNFMKNVHSNFSKKREIKTFNC